MPQGTEPAIDVVDLTVTYGQLRVVDHVSFRVERGEVLGLIGPVGAGKSTLVKTLLDLVRPDTGSVSLFGRDSGDVKSRGAIAYLPENLNASRYLKGSEFVELGLAHYGVEAGREALAHAAARLALDPEALDQSVAVYSKGIMKKIGLMATLMSGRPLLILDEPMTGLDPQARILLKDRLLDHRREGGSIFISSHILSDVDEICDKVAILNDQHFIYYGSPSDLRRRHGATNLERSFLNTIDVKEPALETAAY